MTMLLSQDQVDLLVRNQHHDPFAILGPHAVEIDGQTQWQIRAYLPLAQAAWVVCPTRQQEFPMTPKQDPHLFECLIPGAQLPNYQLRVKEGERERVFYDPYGFKTPKLTDFDLHLFGEGNHHRIYEKLGSHLAQVDGVAGVYFAVWAPHARNVSVIGDFNAWDGRLHQMRKGHTGIWELFVPELTEGTAYKYEIKNWEGHIYEKSDPMSFHQEVRPKTASLVANLDRYVWGDQTWLEQRRHSDVLTQPIAIYEVHLGSWLHRAFDVPTPEANPPVAVSELNPNARYLTYRELAHELIPYVKEMGFTHVELLPIADYPFDGSWGYQVVSYYAATSRYGSPQDFMYFVDQCHQNGIGVIVDWVPGHFPKDGHGLAFFDGAHLYEYSDPRKGEHQEWGTLVFDYGRPEVRNFLVANALFWFDKYHIDGMRVDAVASMIYLDYCRPDGEWVANQYGGREHIEAVDFLRQVNQVIFSYFPGILAIAEESTSWPMVSWPTYVGGLGFNLKWNMGWMHDTLDYFRMDPWFRQFHQNNLTFGIWYAFSENFMLALSHDEVVHGKASLMSKMPGDEWQKFANMRALFAYMFTHPGKKTLFMGMEFGQWQEWNVWGDLEWHLLQYERHQTLKSYLTTLVHLYRQEPALYTQDFSLDGFEWIDCGDNRHSVVSYIRYDKDRNNYLIVVCNFTPQPHAHYRIGVPEPGFYRELFNSDAREFGGSNMGNLGGKWTDEWGYHGHSCSLDLCLPPLGVMVFKLDRQKSTAAWEDV